MKRLIVWATIVAFINACLGQPFNGEIGTLKAQSENAGSGDINAVLLQLKNKIQIYEIADASPLNNPSPERLKRREQIRDSLESVKLQLIDLTQSSNQDIQTSAIEILGFTKPDENLYRALRKVSNAETKPVVTRAYEALFQTGLDRDEIREELLVRLGKFNDRKGSELAFALVNNVSTWEWDLPEALPIYKDILKSSASSTGKVAVANALKSMGGGAIDALGELNIALDDLERSNENFRYISAFKDAIQVIEGKKQPFDIVAAPKASSSSAQASTYASVLPPQEPKFASTKFFMVLMLTLAILIASLIVIYLRRKS